jgi:hypothetical protein
VLGREPRGLRLRQETPQLRRIQEMDSGGRKITMAKSLCQCKLSYSHGLSKILSSQEIRHTQQIATHASVEKKCDLQPVDVDTK